MCQYQSRNDCSVILNDNGEKDGIPEIGKRSCDYMEYNFQNSVDDFRIKYTLVVPEDSALYYQLSEEEQTFLKELDNAYADIERLTCQADGYDYAIAISSGIIAGLIDSFFVGEWDSKNAKNNPILQ